MKVISCLLASCKGCFRIEKFVCFWFHTFSIFFRVNFVFERKGVRMAPILAYGQFVYFYRTVGMAPILAYEMDSCLDGVSLRVRSWN